MNPGFMSGLRVGAGTDWLKFVVKKLRWKSPESTVRTAQHVRIG